MELSDETKRHMSELFGMDFDESMDMDPDEQTKYIEEKNGCKMGYDVRYRIDGVPVEGSRTINDVEKNMDKKIAQRKKEKGREL